MLIPLTLGPAPRMLSGRKNRSSSSISSLDLYSKTLDLHFSDIKDPLAVKTLQELCQNQLHFFNKSFTTVLDLFALAQRQLFLKKISVTQGGNYVLDFENSIILP